MKLFKTTSIASLVLALSATTLPLANLYAQEVEGNNEATQQEVQAPAVRQMESDAGTDLVQTQEQVVPADPKKKITAVSRLKDILPKPFNTPGWKKQQKVMLSLGKYSFKCSNPTEDKDFFDKRQFAAQTAVILAKADMISRIKMNAEASRAYEQACGSKIQDGNTETMKNAFKTVSNNKLFGATTMNQTEAWDGSVYEVAVMMVWSEKLEKTARGIWIEEAPVQKPKENGKSLEDWLNEQDLASMCGPWQYVDKDGIRWFLGVSAASIQDLNGAAEIRAMEEAKLRAMGDALLSLRADIYSSKASESIQAEKGDEQTIRKKFMMNLSESCKAEIGGLGEVCSGTVIHPYTGTEIYVSVYGVSQETALQAMAADDRSVLSEQIFNRGQTIRAGRNAANQAAISSSKNNPKDFQKGYNDQQKKLQGRTAIPQKQDKSVKAQGTPGVSGGANVDYEDF